MTKADSARPTIVKPKTRKLMTFLYRDVSTPTLRVRPSHGDDRVETFTVRVRNAGDMRQRAAVYKETGVFGYDSLSETVERQRDNSTSHASQD